MRHASWICLLIALLATGAQAQETETPDEPEQVETTVVPVTLDAPHLSKKDETLACPAPLPPNSTKVQPNFTGERMYKVGGNIKPPKPKNHVEAKFTDEARKMVMEKHLTSFKAIDLIRLIVDAQGNPQNICVQKPAGYGLDGEAVKAVKKYRFEPATKDGTPVPVQITVMVNFRLYNYFW